MRSHLRFTSLVMVAAALSACSDGTGDGDVAPDLPAVESMSIDLSFFNSSTPAAAAAPAEVAGANWIQAATRVAIANIAVAAHVALPLGLWTAARAQTPAFEDGRWHWRFSTTSDEQSFSGDLTGYLEEGDVVAEMRVSSTQLQLEDVLWFTGRARTSGSSSSGEWHFFNPYEPAAEVGRIDWTHPSSDAWTVTFIALEGSGAGDELAYARDGSARSVTFSDASESTETLITWDETTKTGSITAPNYNDGVKACWDATFANTTCPS